MRIRYTYVEWTAYSVALPLVPFVSFVTPGRLAVPSPCALWAFTLWMTGWGSHTCATVPNPNLQSSAQQDMDRKRWHALAQQTAQRATILTDDLARMITLRIPRNAQVKSTSNVLACSNSCIITIHTRLHAGTGIVASPLGSVVYMCMAREIIYQKSIAPDALDAVNCSTALASLIASVIIFNLCQSSGELRCWCLRFAVVPARSDLVVSWQRTFSSCSVPRIVCSNRRPRASTFCFGF